MDSVCTDVEDLSDFSQRHFRPFVLEIVFIGIVLIELLGKQFQGAFADYFLPFLQISSMDSSRL